MIKVIIFGPLSWRNEMFFLKLLKNSLSESIVAKATYFTHYVSYSNLIGEGFSFKIGRLMGRGLAIGFK